LVTGHPCTQPDDFERRNREHQEKVLELVRRRARDGVPFDLVHDKSGSFWPRAGGLDTPVLATPHLPRDFYPPHLFENVPANVSFNCVSRVQSRSFGDLAELVGVVTNGIALDRFWPAVGEKERSGLLWLGRICEEKAPHLALQIASTAGMPITLAGQVYPFSHHQKYFDNQVVPRLKEMPAATFLPAPSWTTKLP